MKVFKLIKNNLSFGEAIDELIKLESKKAIIVLSGSENGYYFDQQGELKQIDIEEDVNYDAILSKDDLKRHWSLYIDLGLDDKHISLNCIEGD